MELHADTVTDLEGNVVSGATVLVLDEKKNIATIYSESGSEITNPLLTGSRGEFSFCAQNGKYYVQVSIRGRVMALLGPFILYDASEDPNTQTQLTSVFEFLTRKQIRSIQMGEMDFDPTDVINDKFESLNGLYFPSGVYPVSSELRAYKPGFMIRTAGSRNCILRAIKAMPRVLGVYGPDNNLDSLVENVSLSGVTVDGAGMVPEPILVSSCLSFNLYDDIVATGGTSFGLNHSRGFTNRARAVRCVNNVGTGYRLGKEVNQCDFDIESDNNGGAGALVLGADGTRITGGIENNGEDGLHVFCSQAPNIHSLNIDLRYVENNGTKNKPLYSSVKLETAGSSNIMENVTIRTMFMNRSGEKGIYLVGPNIRGLTIEPIHDLNTGNQQALILSSHYTDISVVRAAKIKVDRASGITPEKFTIETGSSSQVSLAADHIFESRSFTYGQDITPSILTGGDTGRVYGIRSGTQWKAGDMHPFNLTVTMQANGKGTSAGDLYIGGLMFQNRDSRFVPVKVTAEGLIYSGQLVAMVLPAPNAMIRLYSQTSGNNLVPLTDSALPANGAVNFYVSGEYRGISP